MQARRSVAEALPYPSLPRARKSKIRMDLNESAWGCSPKVLEAIRNVDSREVSAYPDYQDFAERIAIHFQISPENIVITNGADDGIRAVMQTYIEDGDQTLMMEPSFGMIPIQAKVMGAEVHSILYQSNFSFPIDQFLEAINPDVCVIALVRPDSPTGTVISQSDVIHILRAAPESIILLDETYHHFIKETCIDLIKEFHNLVVLQSFSKAYGLAGLRLGFVASYEKNIQQLNKVNPPFAANTVAIKAGLAAMSDSHHLKRIIEEMEYEKAFLVEELTRMGLDVRNTGANFVLLRVGDQADVIHQELVEKNILVKNLNRLPLLNGHFRVSISTRNENEMFLQALREVLP